LHTFAARDHKYALTPCDTLIAGCRALKSLMAQ
jgi:hypothetical protein